MYNELIDLLNEWGTDIRKLDIKHYDSFIEVLINEHYIYTINRASIND